MTPFPSRFRLVLIGAGRVGTAVAVLLQQKGHEVVAVASRTLESAQSAGDRLAAPIIESISAAPDADLFLIGVRDEAIRSVAIEVATVVRPGSLVCHFAGSLGTDVLTDVAAAGARPCALHPVQACPDVDTAIARIPRSAWGVTCDREVQDIVFRLIREDLEGDPVAVREEDRPLWHAAAVVTSNGTAALLSVGESILASIGVDSPERVLGPLAAGTVENARAGGGGTATLTGPISRGDVATIDRHLAALAERAEELVPSYATVARAIVAAARRSGKIDDAARMAMDALLEAK